MIKGLFTNPYFVSLLSPLALLFLGALGKGIIKGGISRKIWYLGFDAALSALYAGMVYLYDVARDVRLLNTYRIEITAGFLIVAFMAFMVVVVCHQVWERDDKDSRGAAQFCWLGIIANVIGFGLLIAFVLLVKGVA